MAELGKIEKPEAQTFTAKRKLYVIPTLPFEEMAFQYGLDSAKIERFWGEVREKIEHFVKTYGKINTLFIEGMNEDEQKGLEFFEKFGKEKNHYRLVKCLIDDGAAIKGIDKIELIERLKLLFDEYSKTFVPDIEKFHRDFYGKDIDFEGWRNYLVKNIQDTQDEMGKQVTGIIGAMPADSNAILIITDGRPVEFPEGLDVFQIRPPAFDEIERNIRNKVK